MPFEYTIPAIPTIYKGRRYRSRLEARWAAYFDNLGWHHEYEPCDLGKWSPDFALWGQRPDFPIYTEIKPITEWDRDIARKIADASGPCRRILLLGIQPSFDHDIGAEVIGWVGEPGDFEFNWSYAIVGRDKSNRLDFAPEDHRLCLESWLWESDYALNPYSTKDKWTAAANAVQWHKSVQ